MDNFSNALKTWFTNHASVSLRNLADAAELIPIDVGRVRSGEKAITFKALNKLLPAVEKLSSRSDARALLVAYLNDETPAEFSADVRVYAVDEQTGAVEKDIIAAMRDRWEARARSDATFAAWWLTADGYMHEADTDAVDERAKRHLQKEETEIALVAEEPGEIQQAMADMEAQIEGAGAKKKREKSAG